MRTGHGMRGVTMVELLICLGVLAIALGSVLTIFAAGARLGARAQRRMDAARVARAVFDLADSRRTGATWGRDENGLLHDETITNLSGTVVPPGMIVSPIVLVWEATISTPPPGTFDLTGMHLVVTTVSHDSDENGSFDGTDEVIGRWYAVLADR